MAKSKQAKWGMLGALATFKKHGKEHYSKMAKARWAKKKGK